MANHMKKVADILGVDMGEKFQLKVSGDIIPVEFKLTENGVVPCGSDLAPSGFLQLLLTGRAEIVKNHSDKGGSAL